MTTTPCIDLSACSVLELIQHANREQVACHLVDDRLIVHPSRARQDIVDALIARADEVAAFLVTHRRHVWRTPSEEEAYREKIADEMTLTLFGLPWRACEALVIDALATIVGEAWERHLARLPPLRADDFAWNDDEKFHDEAQANADDPPVAPVVMLHARTSARHSMRDGGRRG